MSAPHALSLHHLTALDVSPARLVDIAAELDCPYVCLFTQEHAATREMFPTVADDAGVRQVLERCAATGVGVCDLEYFPIEPGLDLETYRGGLERGARLGATRATAHIHDADRGRALAAFAGLCDLAGEYGLKIGLEFTAFSQVRSLAAAIEFTTAVGKDNGGVVLDALHFFRSGADPADLPGLDLSRLVYVQLCDGPMTITEAARMTEAVGERGIPGEGEFDLRGLVAALPPGPPVAAEVPQGAAMRAGVPALERARKAVEACRRFIPAA